MVKAAAFIVPLPFSSLCAGSVPLPPLIIAALSLVMICPLTAWYYAGLYKKSLGGYSGDALGAAIEKAELFCMAAFVLAVSV